MTFKPLGEALLSEYKRALPDIDFEVIETAGSVTNLQRLESGDAELGLALADVTYMAYNGQIAEFPVPARRVRGVAVLHPSVVHVLVPRDSRAKSIPELHGRIGVGPIGSGTAVTSALLLDAFGVAHGSVSNEPLPFIDAADLLAKGDLGASFVVAADPVDAVTRATRAGARLLEISGETVEYLRSRYPFFKEETIPAGTYTGVAQPIRTLRVDVLLLSREGVDDNLVRRLTGTFFESLPTLESANDFLRRVDVSRGPATPIPLHAGSALYYREREILR